MDVVEYSKCCVRCRQYDDDGDDDDADDEKDGVASGGDGGAGYGDCHYDSTSAASAERVLLMNTSRPYRVENTHPLALAS